ncbi:15268_t:CDS:2, partial [Entrophospora sp. SA101]
MGMFKLGRCINWKINYEECIISYPPILIFELTQRDACAFSTLPGGHYFYCKVIQSFNDQMAVYRYNDLEDGGM